MKKITKEKLKKAFRALKKDAIRASVTARSYDALDVWFDETKATGKYIGACKLVTSCNISISYIATKPAFLTKEIGQMICKRLTEAGLDYHWGGSPGMCIEVMESEPASPLSSD
jgi:hypothetical protein